MIDPATLPARISAIVQRGAEQSPGASALVDDGRVWTYADLQQEFDRYTALLRTLGIRHPIPGVEVRIDASTGELRVRGPNVMAGYYRDPVQTAAALRPGGWLATGDLARMDDDGALFIVGRLKELVIRSGFKVYPLEVETALNSHPGVLQSAVAGRARDGAGEEVVAFVERTKGSTADAAQLQEWLRPRLAPYKRPSTIVFRDALPAAPSGKILKHRLALPPA